MLNNYYFTSESVSDGHPDKVCDIISDSILDLYLSYDPYAKVAVECMVTTGKIFISGEVRSVKQISYEQVEEVVRSTIKEIGYDQPGFSWRDVAINIMLKEQSGEIFMGVDKHAQGRTGAGDQGIMFGFAVNETPDYMPFSIYYCNKLIQNLSFARKAGNLPGLGPDAKCQMTILYDKDIPKTVTNILVSHQHEENVDATALREMIVPQIKKVLPEGISVDYNNLLLNPTGRFVIGGPVADVGLTGRKIIVDTYGGYAPHGGGAFSGKDATKVDRSAAYFARYLAKNIVASGISEKCLIQLSYAIGRPEPQSVYINFFDKSKVNESKVVEYLYNTIDMSVDGIFDRLVLHAPIYRKTAAFGHFGTDSKRR